MRRSDWLVLIGSVVELIVAGAIGFALAMLLTSCAIVNGSAYRVQPCPARSDTTATADSLRRHIGCFDTRDSTHTER